MNRFLTYSWSEIKSERIRLINETIKLPPELCHIFEHYQTGQNCFRHQYFLSNDDAIQFTCLTYSRNEYVNTLSCLLSIDQLEQEVNNFISNFDSYHKHKYLKIGYFDMDDLLLISISPETFGHIGILNVDPLGFNGDKIINTAIGLTAFLTELIESIIESNLQNRGHSVDDLYRKWNDKNWRTE